ncbi:MAG: hypothetical protein E6X23_01360 [Mixta calida]|uniref:hypothetical protein n=1 Tax=Mixta TaxID=2100764 RepID=UPI002588D8D2|nr:MULTISPECIES: hypothetical protein [Mixta]MCR1566935.1 hypothetical protein [Mixta sp.]MDU4940192.1 hypothetical protein [Mixta calida]MDU6536060.1 hypothetical protein [Mixta calida]
MAKKRVPTGFKILLGVGIYIFSFLLARPSAPATPGEYAFWNRAASLFGEQDIDGFVGIALLTGCTIITIIGYQIAIRLIERKMNKLESINHR